MTVPKGRGSKWERSDAPASKSESDRSAPGVLHDPARWVDRLLGRKTKKKG